MCDQDTESAQESLGSSIVPPRWKILPRLAVKYPCVFSSCGSVTMLGSVVRKKTSLPRPRVDSGSSPVRIDARDGLHTGDWTYARSNNTPRRASRSKLGESTTVSPYAPRLFRRSSATMNNTLRGGVGLLSCAAAGGVDSVDIASADRIRVTREATMDPIRRCAVRASPAANRSAELLEL